MFTKPFILSKKIWKKLKYFSWEVKKYDFLSEIDENQKQFFITPFSQAKEKWLNVIDNGEKIVSIIIKEEKSFSLEEFYKKFQEEDLGLGKKNITSYKKEDYENTVREIKEKEIWQGEWSNFVIAQKVLGKINNFSLEKALTIYKNLLKIEKNCYNLFLFFDGERYIISSSPEINIKVEKMKEDWVSKVTKTPIAGTFRKSWIKNKKDFKEKCINFLRDKKEINELFMSIDEEKKILTKVCQNKIRVKWPKLKEMANLIHTYYELTGESNLSRMEILRESMWAPSMTGSPLQNAFHIIYKYEKESRGYYSGALCYIDKGILDSTIILRSIEIKTDGKFEIFVWGKITSDSIPEEEYKETISKIEGLFSALFWNNKIPEYFLEDKILGFKNILEERNKNISRFWMRKQAEKNKNFIGKKILLINNRDYFIGKISYILEKLWFDCDIVKFKNIGEKKVTDYDLVLMWPWPGNPTENCAYILEKLDYIKYLEENWVKYFWVCLWHQLICRYLWIKLVKRHKPTQWIPRKINVFWKEEIMTFYNSFYAYASEKILKKLEKKEIQCSSLDDGEILALKSKKIFSFQFHPESIQSKNWEKIFERFLEELLKK